MTKRSNTKQFIEKAQKVHGNKYNYSKVVYVNNRTKICIICPIHGEFWQSPNKHLKGCGCRKCAIEINKEKQKLPQDTIIQRFKEVHGDKYDYSKVKYVNLQTKVCIICPIHGEFWQSPTGHYFMKEGCPKCSGAGKFYDTEYFIEKAKEIHRNKYDYSKVNINNIHDIATIICPKHGEFRQKAYSHIEGYGCRKCAEELKRIQYLLPQDTIIQRFKEVHGDKYDYSKVKYDGMFEKICIICPIHGEFWQTPNAHLNRQGCPKCQKSKMEEQISLILKRNKIKYEEQYGFEWLKNDDTNYKLYLDFYLPEYNIAIECQGGQHFVSVDFFGGKNIFKQTVNRDIIKYNKCKEHNINIVYIVPKTFINQGIFNENYFDKKVFILEEIKNNLIKYIRTY